MLYYPVAIKSEVEGRYGVTVPDLPGCFSVGDTVEDAIANAKEAIECHIEGIVLDGEPVPLPQPVADHHGHKDHEGAIWSFIPA